MITLPGRIIDLIVLMYINCIYSLSLTLLALDGLIALLVAEETQRTMLLRLVPNFMDIIASDVLGSDPIAVIEIIELLLDLVLVVFLYRCRVHSLSNRFTHLIIFKFTIGIDANY